MQSCYLCKNCGILTSVSEFRRYIVYMSHRLYYFAVLDPLTLCDFEDYYNIQCWICVSELSSGRDEDETRPRCIAIDIVILLLFYDLRYDHYYAPAPRYQR